MRFGKSLRNQFPTTRILTLVLVALLIMPGQAQEQKSLYSINLEAREENGKLAVTLIPEPNVPLVVIQNKTFLDSTFRRAAVKLQVIAARKKWPAINVDIWTFPIRLTVRDLKGRIKAKSAKKIRLGLAAETGQLQIGSLTKRTTYPIADLASEAGYQGFLKVLLGSFENSRLTLPNDDEFLIDLYYELPKINSRKFAGNDFPSAPATTDLYSNNLGSTWCRKADGGLQMAHSLHLKRFRDTLTTRDNAIVAGRQGNIQSATEGLLNYFNSMPSDRDTARQLLMLTARTKPAAMFQLNKDYQPYFIDFRGELALKNNTLQEEQAVRNASMAMRGLDTEDIKRQKFKRAKQLKVLKKKLDELQGKTASFQTDPQCWLRITTPSNGDPVAKGTDVEFILKDGGSKILRIDCLLDGKVVSSLTEPPLRFRIDPQGSQAQELQVVAFFENETKTGHKINVSPMTVDEQQEVKLTQLQVIALRDGQPASGLSAADFTVTEAGTNRPINSLTPLARSLDVTILIDTSATMFNENIYHAQYAVNQFLSRLKEGESASVFSFDEKVLKLKDFQDNAETARPLLYTLSPQWATALHDALLTARSSLMSSQRRTRAIIVISDGKDSVSATTEEQIREMLGQAPIRIYSILLDAKSERFLKQISESSGAFSKVVENMTKLENTLDEVLAELRSIYYLDYYSPIAHADDKDIDVKSSSGKVRWLGMN